MHIRARSVHDGHRGCKIQPLKTTDKNHPTTEINVTEHIFELELEVRDYECDLEGVVNNAVYLNYLEHARHSYLRTRGLDFAHLHEQGCDLVMTRAEIDYRMPLRSGDRFVVRLNIGRESRLRFLFEQTIHRLPDMERILDARIIGTGIIAGKPGLPNEVQALLDGE